MNLATLVSSKVIPSIRVLYLCAPNLIANTNFLSDDDGIAYLLTEDVSYGTA